MLLINTSIKSNWSFSYFGIKIHIIISNDEVKFASLCRYRDRKSNIEKKQLYRFCGCAHFSSLSFVYIAHSFISIQLLLSFWKCFNRFFFLLLFFVFWFFLLTLYFILELRMMQSILRILSATTGFSFRWHLLQHLRWQKEKSLRSTIPITMP